jgi:ribosome-interacting GTPase 1
MASTNQSPFYQRAEEDFQKATTDEERIQCLEIMIKECPKHKSSENMLKNLTTRLTKLKKGVDKRKKAGKGGKQGIKKADMQCVLCGVPNTGKSTIFNILTKKNPESKVSEHAFSTYQTILGNFKFEDAQIQIIDDAPFPGHDKSIINSTDTLLIVINDINQIKEVDKFIWKSEAKKIFIYNMSDKINEKEKRKIEAKIKS